MKSKIGKIAMGIIAFVLVIAIAIPFVSMDSSAAFDKSQYEVVDGIVDYDAMDVQTILKREESLTWVFAGDSITHNNQWTQGMNSYVEWFEQYLYDIKRNNDSVINTAWGGSDILDFQTEENTTGTNGTASDAGMGIENFITKYSPDVVFINVGMNDRDQTTENFKSRYETMLASLYEISYKTNKKIPKVVIIAPTPVSSENVYDDLWDSKQDKNSQTASDEHYDSTLRLRNALNDIVVACKEGGYQVLFSDFRSGFLNKAVEIGADYSQMFFTDPSDGVIHPNAAGQYLMFNLLSETLGIDNDEMSIYQIAYEEFENMALYAGDDTALGAYVSSGTQNDYSAALTENAVWVIAGAEQMSGYEGPVLNRSMLRLFDNALRNAVANRDLRIVSAAAPGNTPAYLDTNFDAVIGEHIAATKVVGNTSVFMLLPEVPEVYETGYDAASIDVQVAAYKGYVESLISKSEANVEILWTPLASGNATINGYLEKYAQAVREVAANNEGVLIFDAYAIMNNLMEADGSLTRNWFDNNGYISPLAATDITYTFAIEIEESYEAASNIVTSELRGHNLRYASDVRVFKGNYIRDHYETVATVNEDTDVVTLDVSAILDAGYTLDTSSPVLLPEAGTGNYHEKNVALSAVTSDLQYSIENRVFTFTAPCSNLNIALYGSKSEDGKVYRFTDVNLIVATENVLDITPNPTSAVLDTLEVVGVPAVDLTKGDTFDVTLYQYQKYPQICATAQDGLKITVTYTGKDGKDVSEVVVSGKNSGLLPEYVTTVQVTVSGTVSGSVTEKTYTLNLTRPDYPDIIITEVMQDGYDGYDVSGYDNYELVEIYNASGRDLNLLNYSIGYKKDYPSDTITETNGEWPYYFTGNNQTFNGKATYTGVNQITKYSSWWLDDETVTEPTEIIFPKDSTMVIWVKEQSAKLTFDTLRQALEENAFAKDQKTLIVDLDGTETAVVPTEEQLVVAEIPQSEYENKKTLSARYNTTADSAFDYCYPDNFKSALQEDYARGWLFILGDNAAQATNGAISQAGNDIISASKFVRVESDRLSSVFTYDEKRGMSLVKEEAKLDGRGYQNLTSFGAIEYWQKPADLGDNTAPTVDESGVIFNVDSDTAAVRLAFSDDNDIRYIELNVKDAEGNITTVEKDIVLTSSVENGGLSLNNKSYEYTYAIADTDESSKISFWGYVEDGNGNVTEFGSEDEEVEVCTKAVQGFTGDKVADYLAKKTYPTMDGKLFAGWYTTESIPEDLEEARAVSLGNNDPDESATYYALFVPKHVLSVKAQVSGTLYDENVTNDDSASIRFVTTVDTLQYKKVGFKVSYLGTDVTIGSHEVYQQLFAVGSTSEIMTEYTPKGEFCQLSNYFKTGTITGIPASYYNTEFSVTPYWITWDGTEVEGVTVVKTIAEGMPKDSVYVSSDGVDQAGYGTYEYPYATLNYAIANVGHCGTVSIKGDYKVSSDFVWDTHNKCVTIAGDAVEATGTKEILDFSALTELRINDSVTFSDITLTLPTVYAEGNQLVILDNVEVTTTPNVYGGSKKLEVAKTDVKLYAGTYAGIYGGGNGTDVAGNTNVIIGGTVNGAIDYENHQGTNNLYGGSRYGTVHGNTNVTVEKATARFHYIYGGGYGSIDTEVKGDTNVMFAGTAMSIYGGSKAGVNADTHVTMTGGYVEQIFGGSDEAVMIGNTDVKVLGGEVKRRVYGGSYNDHEAGWTTDYHVSGYASVTIGTDATLSLNMSWKDNGLYAVSRNNKIVDDEKGVFIFNDYENNSTNIDKIGDNGLSQSVGVVSQAYHYLVKAAAGGEVYSVGDKLRILPDTTKGYVAATVQVDNKVVHYTEGESLYALPALTDDTEEIIVTFGTATQSKDNYVAKIGQGYYPTIEAAFDAVTTDTMIELLKSSVTMSNTINVADGESAILKNAEDVNATIYRADAIVGTSSMFNVATGGKLTIDGITLDGRTLAEITAGTTDLAALSGSTASLINTSGSVVLNDITAQYAVKNGGHGAVVYGEAVSTASLTVNNSEFSYNKATMIDSAGGQGGAICMYAGASSLNVSNSNFANNKAEGNGGAISTHAGNTTITDCTFTANASSANGGAFYSGSNGIVTMTTTEGANEDILFSGNTATNGGAICIGSGTNTIVGYTFEQNTGTTGGTIYIGGSGTVIGENNQFTSNTAISGTTYGNGGAVYCAGTYTDTNSSYTGNTAKNGGAVIVMSGGVATLSGTNDRAVMKQNTANVNGGAAVFVNTNGVATITGYGLEGNVSPNAGSIQVQSTGVAELNDLTFEGEIGKKVYVLGNLTFKNLSDAILVDAGTATNFVVSGYQDGNVVEFTPYKYESKVVLKKTEDITDEEFKTACNQITVTQPTDGTYWFINEKGELTVRIVATITVDGSTEEFTTLKDAVAYANTNGGTGETEAIEILVLEDVFIDDALSISKNTTIVNYSGKNVTISRGSQEAFDMFNVAENATLTLGTNAKDETGKLIVDGTTTDAIAGRTVTVSANAGFVLAKNATLQNANSTTTGAAVYSASSNTAIYGTLQDNTTSSNAGALYAAAGAIVTIDGATISGNSSTGNTGGALCIISGAEVNCQNATISNNHTTTSSNGGAIYCAGTFRDTDSTYTGNYGKHGGAIFVTGSSSANKANVTLIGTSANALFKNNDAIYSTGLGGAIYVNSNAKISVTGYAFEGNTGKTTRDSAINIAQSTSEVTLINLSLTETVREEETIAQTIYYKNGSLTYSGISADLINTSKTLKHVVAGITQSGTTTYYDTLADAVAYANTNGGTGETEAIEIVVLEDVTIDAALSVEANMTIVNFPGKEVSISRASDDVYDMFMVAENAMLTLGTNAKDENGKLIVNGTTTSAIDGRTVTVPANAGFVLAKNATLQNANSSSDGAAIQTASANTTIYGTLKDNKTSLHAGALYAAAGAIVTIDGATISGNSSTGDTGGALCIMSGAEVNSQNAVICGNETISSKNGGAIYCAGAFRDTDSCYEDNEAKNGGAIFVASGGNVCLTGNNSEKAIFKNNTVTTKANGGAIYVQQSNSILYVEGYTFTENTSGNNTAVYICATCEATLKNITFEGDAIQNIYVAGTLKYSALSLTNAEIKPTSGAIVTNLTTGGN